MFNNETKSKCVIFVTHYLVQFDIVKKWKTNIFFKKNPYNFVIIYNNTLLCIIGIRDPPKLYNQVPVFILSITLSIVNKALQITM